jgi:arsenate reductase
VDDRVFNVLFLCTGNSARSILAESIMRQDGAGRFLAYSAGSHPNRAVQPLALKVLGEMGYPTDGFYSKSWDVFAEPGAPIMDFVFTVCDDAAGEACPLWPGQPITAHWGIEDPAKANGSELERTAAFVKAFRYLNNRIQIFLNLPLKSLGKAALTSRLQEIGGMEGRTQKILKV